MTVGLRLKNLREKKDKTQVEVCKDLNIEQSTLANYENGKRIPKIDILIKLAQYYSTTTDFILGISNEPDSINSQDLEWRYPSVENRLGTILRKFRSQSQLSESDFAKELETDEDLITQIEHGIYTPSLSLMKKLSTVTGYDMDFLLGATSSTHGENGFFESDFHFCTRLEELCLRDGVNYDNVTELLGLSKKDFMDLKFNRMPTLPELLRISYGFGVSIDYLIGRSDIPNINLTDDELDLLLDYRDCVEPYKKNLRERAHRLSLESISSDISVAPDEHIKKTGTDNSGK